MQPRALPPLAVYTGTCPVTISEFFSFVTILIQNSFVKHDSRNKCVHHFTINREYVLFVPDNSNSEFYDNYYPKVRRVREHGWIMNRHLCSR